MRVCLISPPTVPELGQRRLDEPEALRLIAEHVPVGILSLAAVLEARGLKPHFLDLNRLYYDYIGSRDGGSFESYFLQRLRPESFDVLGFGTICSSYPLTLRLAGEAKRAHAGAAVVLGGPQASVVDVPTMQAFPFVDFVVRGEAEVTLPLLLDVISEGSGREAQLAGVTHRLGSQVVRNPAAPAIEDLDGLPLPAYHLFPHISEGRFFSLEAGRGCPFACSFCSTNDFFRRRFRMKSPHVLVGHMKLIKETYGIDSFDLIHDMFTADRKRVLSFCEAVEVSGEEFSWSCSARTDCLDDDLIARMARAGCAGMFFGIDSGSERIQEVISKRLDLREAASRVRRAQAQGVQITVSLITGFPEETKEDLRATVRFLGDSLRYRRAEPQLHLLAPLAETPITTRFKGQLIYDHIFSDVSILGWEQDAEDRALVTAHPDIFPNFYAVPTPWLDRRYLKELREFLINGAAQHRWLMTFLHDDAGDLMKVFDDWVSWLSEARRPPRRERTRSYYTSRGFSRDLLLFVRDHYAAGGGARPHLASTMTVVEGARLSLNAEGEKRDPRPSRRRKTFALSEVPVIPDGIRLVEVEADYKRLIACLKRKGRLDRVPAGRFSLALTKVGDEIKVLQLSDLSRRLLTLCDGSRKISDVANLFSLPEKIENVSEVKAGLYGLSLLISKGLLNVRTARA